MQPIQSSNAGRTIVQILIAISLIALIVSLGRTMMTSSERSASFGFDLSATSGIVAYSVIILTSVACIVTGVVLGKTYDFIILPLVMAGISTLIYATISAYYTLNIDSYNNTSVDTSIGQLVLAVTIALEWAGALWLCWKEDGNSAITAPLVVPPQNAGESNTISQQLLQ